jgi:hypothetical protein
LNLEFFAEGLDGGPMILLYGGGPDDVALLQNALRTLSEGVGCQVALNDLSFVRSVDKCQVRALSGETDLGVVTRAPVDFEWTLGPESWRQVDEQLEPFCEEKGGVSFQYLNPGSGPAVIYSTARAW